MPVKTIFHSSCMMDGKIYVMGGYQYTGIEENCKIGSTIVQVYNPVADSWDTTRTDLPEPRVKAAVAGIGDKIYLFGGTSGQPDGICYDNILVYDIKKDQYQYANTVMTTARLGSAACVYDGKIHIVGGLHSDQSEELDLHEVFDPEKDNILIKPPMSTPRGELRLIKSGSLIYAIGGCSGLRGSKSPLIRAFNTIESYSPETETWRREEINLPRGMYAFGAVEWKGRIYLCGGLPSNYENLFTSNIDYIYVYIPDEKSVYTTSSFGLPRSISSASLHDGEIILIGGENYNWNCNEGLEYRFRSEVESYKPLQDPVFAFETFMESLENSTGEKLVRFQVRFSNPSAYPLKVFLECRGKEKNGVYKEWLYDDGEHEDGLPVDGLYGSVYIGPFAEDEYNVNITAENTLSKENTTTIDRVPPFTTVGPILYTGISFEGRDKILNPGDSLPFNLFLKNMGKEATARNITVSVLLGQAGAYHYGNKHLFGPIFPGEEKKCLFGGAIKLDKSYPPRQNLILYLSIYSNGRQFWNERIEVRVK